MGENGKLLLLCPVELLSSAISIQRKAAELICKCGAEDYAQTPAAKCQQHTAIQHSIIATRNADMLDLAGIIVWVEKRAAVSPAM